jgi:DNA-binding protein HU-beta
LNRRELVNAVAAQAELDAKQVDAVLRSFTDVVTAVVAKGEPVAISGFAKFAKVERAARMGRNPATGEPVKIKASKKARITPLKAFKDAVMAPSQAPKLAKGVWPPAPKPAAKKAAPAKKAPAKKAPAKKAPAARKR